jgi:hypothetical protein
MRGGKGRRDANARIADFAAAPGPWAMKGLSCAATARRASEGNGSAMAGVRASRAPRVASLTSSAVTAA